VRVQADDLKTLSRDLKRLGDGRLGKDLQSSIREAAKPLVPAIRAAVQATPSKGSRATGHATRAAHAYGRSTAKNKKLAKFERKAGLRETIARAVALQASASGGKISVSVRADMLPPDQRGLPWALEGVGGKPWRHPLFGNSEHWYTQQAHPYFANTIEAQIPGIDRAVEKAMDDAVSAAGF
jgi:hypothetical protein